MKSHDESDVTCRSVMDASPAMLAPATTVAMAVQTLLDKRLLAMPVVNEEGRYLGMFRKVQVIASVLPQVVVHDDRLNPVARMIDAGLLGENLRDVRIRFSAIAGDPVSLHVDKDAPVLHPDQSLVAALFYLYRGHNFLPVVDAANNRLLGVVSTWDVLESIATGS